jgi:hypothetical protein
MKLDQQAPIATVDELADYDAILFGTPTRFGNMAAADCRRPPRAGYASSDCGAARRPPGRVGLAA